MTDYMMDFSNDDLESGKELEAAREGEYRLRLKDWKTDEDGKVTRKTEDGRPYILPVMEIIDCEGMEYMKDFTHFLWLVDEDMEPKKKNNARFALREFWTAFGIDYRQPIDPEAVIGATAEALLSTTEDDKYGLQNRVQRFMSSR